MEEVILLSMRSNAAHGRQNTVEDRVLMMNKLIQMDEQRFMKNAFMVDTDEVMAALQITKKQARMAIDPKNEELKVRRDAAILELHKGGKTAYAISKALGLSENTTRRAIEEMTTSKMPSGQNGCTPNVSVLPLANTEDRPDTRKP